MSKDAAPSSRVERIEAIVDDMLSTQAGYEMAGGNESRALDEEMTASTPKRD